MKITSFIDKQFSTNRTCQKQMSIDVLSEVSEERATVPSSYLLMTIGEILLEKEASLRSKRRDQTATVADQMNLAFASEVIAMAKNRISVWENELKRASNAAIWVERTSSSHNPHIRLHGGVREDDPPK